MISNIGIRNCFATLKTSNKLQKVDLVQSNSTSISKNQCISLEPKFRQHNTAQSSEGELVGTPKCITRYKSTIHGQYHNATTKDLWFYQCLYIEHLIRTLTAWDIRVKDIKQSQPTSISNH